MDGNLELIYQESYQAEWDLMHERFGEAFRQARDKKFAVQFQLAMFFLPYGFHHSCTLTKRILEHYDHCYKLGFKFSEIVEGIPKLIRSYNEEAVSFRKNNRHKRISIDTFKWLGIPVWPKGLRIHFDSSKDPYFMAGPFPGLTSTQEIAEELGRIKSLQDFFEFLKARYRENGGDLDPINQSKAESEQRYQKLKDALDNKDLNGFFIVIKSLFASNPYYLEKTEASYHNIMHTILGILGFTISELATNRGRIDAVYETTKYVYLFEFKLDQSNGMAQILEKKYYERYLDDEREIVLVEVSFSSSEKNIASYQYLHLNK